tara:strand:+ start:123 stop:2669 length:2547 start_codon:yes stop_codon:yes gene_type:complete
MKITGKKTRSVAERSSATFCVSGSINNVTGSGVFGISGATQNLEFGFVSGKIYDPDNKYFGSYTPDRNFAISGNLSGSKYDYYIADENSNLVFQPINYKGTKTDEKLRGFYLDASGCEMDVSPFIRADRYPYHFDFPTEFDSAYPFTGELIAEGTSDTFEIFSGLVKSPTEWVLTGFDQGRLTSSNIKLASTGTVNSNLDYIIDFDLYTNFGNLSKTVTGKAITPSSAGNDFTLSSSNSFSQTGSHWNLSNTSTGNYPLDYSLAKNGTPILSDKPIQIELTNNYNSSGNVKTGYLVTGVQLRGRYQNGFFLDTPTVTFSSNDSSDVQASGVAKMADYMVADFYSGTSSNNVITLTGIVVKTITGIDITNSGSYVTPTGIKVSFSHPSTTEFYPNPCPYYKYTRLPLQASSPGVNYQLGTSRDYWYYDSTIPNVNLYTELSGTDLSSVVLAKSGSGFYDRKLSGVWQLVTGTATSQEKYGFNAVDAAWGSGSDEVNHIDGIPVTGTHGQYYDSSKTDDSTLQIRLKCHLPKNKVSITEENELQISGDPKYQSNYATATVQQDFYNHYPELRNLISTTLLEGGEGTINLSYSFIKSGTTGRLVDGSTVGIYQDFSYTSHGSEPSLTTSQLTGEVVSAFSEWKGLLETIYTGLTINFLNSGVENITSVPVVIGTNTYAIPHPDDSSIGDIRIGMLSGTQSALGWAIVTGGLLNVSGDEVGDITIDNGNNWRLDNDTANNGTCYSFKLVTTHEIGHSLGFGHDRDKSGIMYYSAGTTDSIATNYPNGLSGSYRNQDMVRNFYSYSKNPDHEILKTKQAKGHRDKMSVNLFITGSGSGLNQIVSGITPSGYSV